MSMIVSASDARARARVYRKPQPGLAQNSDKFSLKCDKCNYYPRNMTELRKHIAAAHSEVSGKKMYNVSQEGSMRPNM